MFHNYLQRLATKERKKIMKKSQCTKWNRGCIPLKIDNDFFSPEIRVVGNTVIVDIGYILVRLGNIFEEKNSWH